MWREERDTTRAAYHAQTLRQLVSHAHDHRRRRYLDTLVINVLLYTMTAPPRALDHSGALYALLLKQAPQRVVHQMRERKHKEKEGDRDGGRGGEGGRRCRPKQKGPVAVKKTTTTTTTTTEEKKKEKTSLTSNDGSSSDTGRCDLAPVCGVHARTDAGAHRRSGVGE